MGPILKKWSENIFPIRLRQFIVKTLIVITLNSDIAYIISMYLFLVLDRLSDTLFHQKLINDQSLQVLQKVNTEQAQT